MKLVDYAESIKRLAKKHPNATVVYASDEEGNEFKETHFYPAAGNFDGTSFDSECEEVNSVCIN